MLAPYSVALPLKPYGARSSCQSSVLPVVSRILRLHRGSARSQALEDPVESVRQAAVVAIGEIEPGSRLLEPVVGLLRSSDVTIRRAAVRALLQVDASQLVPALVAAGRDPDAEVRQGIVSVVGEWGGAAVSPWLRERLAQDSSPGVRAEAAYRLGTLSDPETRAALNTTIAKDPDSGVRRWAKRGV